MFKIRIQKFHIPFFQFGITADFHSLRLQSTFQFCISSIFTLCQQFHLLKDRKQLFLTGHICLIITDIFGYQHLIIQRTDTYHKKFIQITLENRCKR